MIRRQAGFTLVELMITMVVFVFVIAAASQVLTGLLTQFKQQSKITETNIEGIVGLEILRQDIASAGYGLPWNGLVPYAESSANPFSLNDATTGVPKAIISRDSATYSSPNNIFDGSDYLVVKAVNITRNSTSEKWTLLNTSGPRTWVPDRENVNKDDSGVTDNNVNVIVLSPGTHPLTQRLLITSGGAFSTIYTNVTATPWKPTDATESRIVYGLAPSNVTAVKRPFNRADYFIRRFDAGGVSITPQRCAPNTGVLEKATMTHNDAGTFDYLPLLDCVADMQVIYGLDNDNDGDFEPGAAGSTDGYSENITGLPAQQIRDQVKQVRVYVLGHEGQADPNYTYSSSTVSLGGDVGLGRTYNLGSNLNYRWKVYTIVVQPNSLR